MGRVLLEVDLPGGIAGLALPEGIRRRLHVLLDKQDRGEALTADERLEAEGLTDLAELPSLLRLRAERRGTPDTAP
jgi:hypothetical protein